MRFIDLHEGPNDPGIFKAVFLAGGPGSGKSFVATQLGLKAHGLRVVNSDDALEYLMQKHDLDLTMPPEQQPQRDVVRARAKQITKTKQNLYLDGRLGLIIDGTAKDVRKMADLKRKLEEIGYQTMMVFVNTSLRTALERNNMRPRRVPIDIVTASHKQVQDNKLHLADLFSPNYIEVNNEGVTDFASANKAVNKFISMPLTPKARNWVADARLQTNIKEESEKKPKVYVDMDGVLANFYAGVTARTGHSEPRDLAFQDMEDTMASFAGTDFFYTLPKYEQTDQLISMVNAATDGDWYILSSPLKYDREGSAVHKARWIKDKLNIQPRGMHFTGDKAKYATQPDGTPNILIDDYPQYLTKWTDAGGIGVKYKGHVGNIRDVEELLDQHFSKKKVTEETRQPGEYVYHASYAGDDKAKLLRSLLQRGLQPSARGYSGPGTYFAYEPDGGYYHVAPEESVILRVKWKDLVNLYGTYPQNQNGIERDDEEIVVPGPVPADIIEIEYFDNEWWDLESALDAETYQFETIRKVKGGHRLLSKKGKNLGTYPTKAGAEKRERQVQYFKHLGEKVTPADLQQIEKYADKLFGKVGIDVNFTKHFIDRVNDPRNGKSITPAELTRLFKQEFKRWGKPIAQMGPEAEAVMKDMQTDVNLPFVLKWDRNNQELDLVAKTVMRKPNFKSPDPIFPVESIINKGDSQ
jgi:predicted kinase